MPQNSRQYELVLLGPTGYTGKLTAEYIAENCPTDLKWAVAGRNHKKIEAVVEEIARQYPNRPKPAIEICELKQDDLDVLVKKTKLVLTTIGPFMYYGEPVVEACAKNGTHYLDCTGETPWVYDMIAKYHETAKKTGAIMIPQAGVDSVPADLISYVLAQYIRHKYNAKTLSVTNTLYTVKGGFSGGTLLTATGMFEKYPLSKLKATIGNPYSLSPVPPKHPARRPSSGFPYSLFRLVNIPELGGIQTLGMMAGVNTPIVHRSWGLFEAIAQQDPSKKDLTYGPRFRYTEHMRAKSFFVGALVFSGFMTFGALLAFPLTRWLMTPLLNHILPGAGQGPSKESTVNAPIAWRAVAVADTEKKEKITGEFSVTRGGGYWLTGVTLAEAAMVMLRGDLGATQAGRLGGGILTPATLGDQYVERLRAAGVKIGVDE